MYNTILEKIPFLTPSGPILRHPIDLAACKCYFELSRVENVVLEPQMRTVTFFRSRDIDL